MITKSKICLAALALALVPAPANAEQVSVTVYFADLDLENESEIATLKGRLNRAIKKVCGPAYFRTVSQLYQSRKCRRSLRRQAKTVLNDLKGGVVTVATNLRITYRG